jgi:rubrerythrin
LQLDGPRSTGDSLRTTDPESHLPRRRFLQTLAGAGAGTLASVAASCGGNKQTSTATSSQKTQTGLQFGTGDAAILKYALTLEYVGADFYDRALGSGVLRGKPLALLRQIREDERQHVATLTGALQRLGTTPPQKPSTKFPALHDARSVLQLAATIENLSAAAYLGQADVVRNPAILAAALSIHTVEGRHAAALNHLLGRTVTPDGAFARPASMAEVLPQVKPFLVG